MNAEVPALRQGLMAIAQGRPAQLPKERKEIQLSPGLLSGYVGKYQLAPSFAIEVTRQGDQLLSQATGQGAAPVFAEAKDAFFFKVVDAQLTFEREGGKETGKMVRMILHQGGRQTPGERVIE